jgi:hypothetical protein
MMNGADRINTTDLVPLATSVYEEALAAVDAELAKGFNSFKNPLGDNDNEDEDEDA